MPRVLSNNTTLAVAYETSLGVPSTNWFVVERNDTTDFTQTFTTTAADPISKNRQRRKGKITDSDSTVTYDMDLTMSNFRHFIEGFVFSQMVNKDVTRLDASGAETTGDTYTGLTALTAAQATKFAIDTLIWVTGGSDSANNGLKVLDTAAVATDTSLAVADNLVDETASFKIDFAGHRITTADVVSWDYDSVNNTGTLSLTGIETTLQTLGLNVGQTVHIGSIASEGGSIQNAFENSATNDMYGLCRVKSFGTDSVVFDKLAPELKFDDLTDPTAPIDILFGNFIRNVPVDDSEFLERSNQFELSYPNLMDGGATGYEYSLGNYSNTLTINVAGQNKVNMEMGFVGTRTEDPVLTQKTGADTPTFPDQTNILSTASELLRLRVLNDDDSGLADCFKDVSLTIDNLVTPEKCLGTLGATFINYGNMEVSLSATALFTDQDLLPAIRNNKTLTMDFAMANEDGIVNIDIPSMTIGGGSKGFPVNESVTIDLEINSFQDNNFNTSIGVSIIPVPITKNTTN